MFAVELLLLVSLQVKALEELCTAQQNSLEESEEKYRKLTESHDALHHCNLQYKAQLVTAQAQVRQILSGYSFGKATQVHL
jgi:phage shock protein A